MASMTRALRPLSVLTLLWLATTAAMFQGCDGLFKPRTPEPPSSPGVPVDYSSIEATLETMNQALQAKTSSNARSAWTGALATANDGLPFKADYDDGVLAKWISLNSGKSAPSPWTATPYEDNFYSNFVLNASPQAQVYELFWETDQQHPNDEDQGPGTGYSEKKVTHKHYLVLAEFENGRADTVAVGFADLTFIHANIGSRWVIADWADRVDPAVGVNPDNKAWVSFTQRRLDSL
jgi:hypothetical protein